ncbi:DNA repair protein RecN, partial [Mannheimia haemolytica]
IKMAKQYGAWKGLNKQVKNFQQQCQENEARKQLLQYQVEELDDFAIKENEFEEMEEKYNVLSSSEELTELSDEIMNLLSNDEINANDLI